MTHLCNTCKTNCLDKAEHTESGTRITACDYHIEEEYKYSSLCKKCNKPRFTYTVVKGELIKHDTCLGIIPGVISACCGHGEHVGHIVFEDRTRITFP